MLIETILGYKSSWRILLLLSQTPIKPISRTEIKNLTYLGNEATNSSLKRLIFSKILIQKKKGKKEYYYYNLENEISKQILDLLNIEKTKLRYIPYKIHILLNEFSRKVLDKSKGIHNISLFGSYAKGNARVNSDVDIALIMNKNSSDELIIENIIEEINNIFKISIQIHYFSKEEYDKGDENLIKEIKNDEIVVF